MSYWTTILLFQTLGVTLATLGQQWRATAHDAVFNERVASGASIYGETFQKRQELLANVTGAPQAAQMTAAQAAQLLARESALLAHVDYFGLAAVLGFAEVLVTLIQRVFR